MDDNYNILVALVLSIVFMLGIALGSYIESTRKPDIEDQAREAIKQCEATIPRNLNCKYVITAEVEK